MLPPEHPFSKVSGQWFVNLTVSQNHLEGLLERVTGLHSQSLSFSGSGLSKAPGPAFLTVDVAEEDREPVLEHLAHD